jgi:trehalose 6-phosphate phosphatase
LKLGLRNKMQMMHESLLKVVTEVKQRLKSAARVSLFLDFDGTLVPIEADPASPRLDSGTAEALRELSSGDFLVASVISGRAIEDLYARIRIRGLIYAGNHGLQIVGRNLLFVEPRATARRLELERLCAELRVELQPIEGTIVEFKGLTGSVHYRKAAESDRPAIETAVRAAVARMGDLFRLNRGKKVFEILPRTSWHKGAAVRWINDHLGKEKVLSVYVGDDSSDEDAFCIMRDAVTVKVGLAGATCARHRLPDPSAVREFLLWLAIQELERPRTR